MLTRQQHTLLMFIARFSRELGYAPTYAEAAREMKLASKSQVSRLIGVLVDKGYIRRIANRARAIEVIRLPDNVGSTSDRQTAVADAAPEMLVALRAMVTWAEVIEELYKEEWGGRDDDAPQIVRARALIARLDGLVS